jgi:hypothetical protein
MTNSTRTTGGDPAEGADPGGTRSTKPGNPDKSGPARPERVSENQKIVSGDRNAGRPDELAQDPND